MEQYGNRQKASPEACNKYCYQSCSQYFETTEFGTCVSANVDCNCFSKFHILNPFVLTGMVVGAFLLLFIGCYFYQRGNRGISRRTIVAQPITPTPGCPMAQVATPNPNFMPTSTAPVTSIPSEYGQPPSYNDVFSGSGEINNLKRW